MLLVFLFCFVLLLFEEITYVSIKIFLGFNK